MQVYLECLLKVVVLLEEHAIVDDDLGRGYAQVNNAVVDSLARLAHTHTHITQ